MFLLLLNFLCDDQYLALKQDQNENFLLIKRHSHTKRILCSVSLNCNDLDLDTIQTVRNAYQPNYSTNNVFPCRSVCYLHPRPYEFSKAAINLEKARKAFLSGGFDGFY